MKFGDDIMPVQAMPNLYFQFSEIINKKHGGRTKL
jgi:hypothetical protein